MREDDRSSRSLFLSFLNDGDPIIKADAEYIARRLRWPMAIPSDAFSSRRNRKGDGMVPVADLALKPSNRLFVHSGCIFLLAPDISSPSVTFIKEVDNEELDKKAALSWGAHGIKVYRSRIKFCEAGHGDAQSDTGGQYKSDDRKKDPSTRKGVENLMPLLFMIIP
jgi:hypothetical protein